MAPNQPLHNIRVFIVDDIARIRQDLRTVLALAGHVVVVGEAANGQEAVEKAEALQPDVVLMDLAMPVMDGYAATRQIKVRCPAARVIAFTIHTYPEARQLAQQAGVDDFIEKGADIAVLVQSIEQILERPILQPSTPAKQP